MKRVAIFASGSGSNAEQIIRHFQGNQHICVEMVLTNNKNAFVLKRAATLGIPAQVFSRQQLFKSNYVLDLLNSKHIDLIVLAGFLWLIPDSLVKAFPGKIVNIHPALLPKYGGKNMYGMRVHEAVISAGEPESGISIHYVDELYDHGSIIFQDKCEVSPEDSPQSLAAKIHQLEHRHYPEVIEKILNT